MDLANLTETYTPDVAFTVELTGPDEAQLFNDDGSPMTWDVLGAESEIGVKASNAAQNRRLAAGMRAKLTAEGLESDGASYIAKLSTGWNITMGGQKPPFSYEAALQILRNPKLKFIRDKLDAAIGERSNFLKVSRST